jgi:hypothetical protein
MEIIMSYIPHPTQPVTTMVEDIHSALTISSPVLDDVVTTAEDRSIGSINDDTDEARPQESSLLSRKFKRPHSVTESTETEEVKRFREGCELTIKQFENAFEKFNIVTIDPVGLPFNADHHQAMVMQVVEGAEPNTVVNVFQKGYMLNGRLLRPAMVVVAKAAD